MRVRAGSIGGARGAHRIQDLADAWAIAPPHVHRLVNSLKAANLLNADVVESVGRERRYRFTVLRGAEEPASAAVAAATVAPAKTSTHALEALGPAASVGDGAGVEPAKSLYWQRGVSTTFVRRQHAVEAWLLHERVMPYSADALAQYVRPRLRTRPASAASLLAFFC